MDGCLPLQTVGFVDLLRLSVLTQSTKRVGDNQVARMCMA